MLQNANSCAAQPRPPGHVEECRSHTMTSHDPHQVTALTCDLASALSDQSSRAHREREARSVALENTYVHQVYHQMAEQMSGIRHHPWPRVAQFLSELEPGSIICDVGCGDGKYMTLNSEAYFIGVDRCRRLASNAYQTTKKQTLVCDNLQLPFRDECADAVVSVAVIHHLATTERRVRALRELARILRIGGKLVVTVWAMEQQNRKFESQDVLVPWERMRTTSGDEKVSGDERETMSTTSDDEAHHYCAYTQTSDSDSSKSHRHNMRRNGKRPRRVRAIDPCNVNSSQSSSDLSSPSETCYSFVRRALQKLAGTHGEEMVSNRPWIASAWSSQTDSKSEKPEDVLATIGAHLIDMRLDEDLCGLDALPKRRNTLGSDSPSSNRDINLTAFKSHSVGSMWSLISASIRTSRKLLVRPECEPAIPLPSAADVAAANIAAANSAAAANNRPKSFACDAQLVKLPDSANATLSSNSTERKSNRKSVTFSTHSLTLPRENAGLEAISEKSKSDSVLDAGVNRKQDTTARASLTTVQEGDSRESSSIESKPVLVRQQCVSSDRSPDTCPSRSTDSASPIVGILKQNSLNENLIHTERMAEREDILSKMRKHRSLNDNMPCQKTSTSESNREGIFSSYRRLQFLKDSLNKLSESIEKISENETVGASLKNGLVKIMKQWTDSGNNEESSPVKDNTKHEPDKKQVAPVKTNEDYQHCHIANINTNSRSPPEFDETCLPHRYSIGENSYGNPHNGDRHFLYKYCSRERKMSREESSDSSKENSFQSDTSLDSEDSCISVIYVPRPDEKKERSRSVSSESSDEKQLSPKSPHSTGAPLSPTRLAGVNIRHPAFKISTKFCPQNSAFQNRFHLVDSQLGAVRSRVPPKQRERSSTITCFDNNYNVNVDEGLRDKLLLRSNSLDSSAISNIKSIDANTIGNVDKSNEKSSRAGNVKDHQVTSSESSDPSKSQKSVSDKTQVQPEKAIDKKRSLLNTLGEKPPSPFPSLDTRTKFDFSSAQINSENNKDGNNATKTDVNKVESLTDFEGTSLVSTENIEISDSERHAEPTDTPADRSSTFRSLDSQCEKISVSSQLSTLVMDENIEIIRRPGSKGICNVHVIQPKPLPKYLTFEVFNPETDDLDSESSCASGSSSPSSVCSVISLASEWASTQEMLRPITPQAHLTELEPIPSTMDTTIAGTSLEEALSAAVTREIQTRRGSSPVTTGDIRANLSPTCISRSSMSPSPTDLASIRSTACLSPSGGETGLRSSRSSLATASTENVTAVDCGADSGQRQTTSPRTSRSRKLGVSRLDPFFLEQVVEESDWQIQAGGYSSPGCLASSVSSTSSLSASDGGGSLGIGGGIGVGGGESSSISLGGSDRAISPDLFSTAPSSDSEQSSAPSTMHGVKLSSDVSSSRATHSVNSRSKLTPSPEANLLSPRSSLTPEQCRPSSPRRTPLASGKGSTRSRHPSSDGSQRSEHSSAPFNHHRYYHVFHEGELDSLIERYVDSLHIISSYYDHANWCIVAEKVQVWTI